MSDRTYNAAARLAMHHGMNEADVLDGEKASTELARLLWHVRSDDGGFQGLTDDQRSEKCTADPRLRMIDWEIIEAFAYDAGQWPEHAEGVAQ